jgi:GT2 family glycosyltransferase
VIEVPVLSVVIVAYKSRDEIRACLASIPRALERRAVEIIVVDNSPGDGAGDIVMGEFPAALYLAVPENLGFGRANNLGFSRARGAFVLFLNPDTVVNETALAHCLRRLHDDGGIGLISPRLVRPDGTMDLACRRSLPRLWDGFARAAGLARAFPRTRLFSGYNLTHLPENATYAVGAINGAFMMGPRSVFEAVADPKPAGVFDERFFMYGDDLDLCIRVARAGWKIVYDGSVQLIHVKGVSVAKEYDAMSRAIFDANRDVYLKHFNPRQSSLVRWKYRVAFGAWKTIARLRAAWRGHREVRPL